MAACGPTAAAALAALSRSVHRRLAGYTRNHGRIAYGPAGPVQVALAKTRENIPGEHALPGGSMYKLKRDGFRALVRDGTVTRLWSRQGKDLTDHFADVARAATAVPSGTVLDGELLIWNGALLDSTCCSGGR